MMTLPAGEVYVLGTCSHHSEVISEFVALRSSGGIVFQYPPRRSAALVLTETNHGVRPFALACADIVAPIMLGDEAQMPRRTRHISGSGLVEPGDP